MADPKTEIEKALVAEVADGTDYGKSFSRIFNRDGDSFSRIFSRGNPALAEVSAQDLATMDDATFKKFSDRLQMLQQSLIAAPPESTPRR
jgi:hypothetical protein